MSREHGLTLLDSEMDEIQEVVRRRLEQDKRQDEKEALERTQL